MSFCRVFGIVTLIACTAKLERAVGECGFSLEIFSRALARFRETLCNIPPFLYPSRKSAATPDHPHPRSVNDYARGYLFRDVQGWHAPSSRPREDSRLASALSQPGRAVRSDVNDAISRARVNRAEVCGESS